MRFWAALREQRLGFAQLLLALFLFQSFLVQSHFHTVAQTGRGYFSTLALASGSTVAAPSNPGNVPTGDSDTNCPVCWQVQHAGSYFAPAGHLPIPPPTALAIVTALLSALPAPAFSHSWQGRAPPRF